MTPENKSVPSVMSDKSDPSVSTLKSLVPPLDLCKQIPPEQFSNSALIWFYDGKDWWVNAREFDATSEKEFPAPTLQEILNELPKYNENEVTLACVPSFLQGDKGRIFGEAWAVGYTAKSSVTDANPATAALKLYLSLLSDPSVLSVSPEAQP